MMRAKANSTHTFFKDKNVHTGRKKWYDLLAPSTYNWFWDVYTNYIGLTTLSDEQIVTLNDIFDITKFINPTAIKIFTFIMHGYSTVSACFHPIIPAMILLVTTVSTIPLGGSQSL